MSQPGMQTIRVLGAASLLLALAACKRAVPPTTVEAPGAGPALIEVPAGWFWMGADDGRESNQPRHRVYLDAYEIHETEVTHADFERFIAATGYQADGWKAGSAGSSRLPVVGVLWKDADSYCRWLGLRLPSEAEWEKAARGEDARRYPWGVEWDPKKANTAESSVGEVTDVGSYPDGASPYGLLDMCGNAAEWVADTYDLDYYKISPERNPTGPDLVMDHVLRGGSFDSPSENATTYFRDSSHSARPNLRVGFRCAVSVNNK